MSTGFMKKSADGIGWQDYRASTNGMVVFYTSDPVSEMAIREIPEELVSAVTPEPNYETGTYGFYGCDKTKIRGAFVKSKIRYLFFLTKYAGNKEDFKDKMLITGYYRIVKTADVQKLHLRYLDDCSCIDAASCMALRADAVHFVGLTDAFAVTEEQLKDWGYNAKVSRQLRIILSPENTAQLLGYLKEKPNQLDAYMKETKRLSPDEEEPEAVEDSEAAETTVIPQESVEVQETEETTVISQESGEVQEATVFPQETTPQVPLEAAPSQQIPPEPPLPSAPQQDVQPQ